MAQPVKGDFESLVNLVKDESPDIRREAISLLGGLQDPRAIPSLVEALAHFDVITGTEAKKALDRIDPNWRQTTEAKTKLPMFFDALHDIKRAGTARLALAAMQKVAIPGLARKLCDKDRRVREEAATAIGFMGPHGKEAVPALIDALKQEDSPYVARRFIDTLSSLRDPRAIPILEIMSSKPQDSSTRNAARNALIYLGVGPQRIADLSEVERAVAIALKAWYRARAKAWWETSGRRNGACDDGNEPLAYGEGFYRPAYLCCERCTDQFLIGANWEEALRDLNAHFGPGVPVEVVRLCSSSKPSPSSKLRPSEPRHHDDVTLAEEKRSGCSLALVLLLSVVACWIAFNAAL